jgi:hypothetical protein
MKVNIHLCLVFKVTILVVRIHGAKTGVIKDGLKVDAGQCFPCPTAVCVGGYVSLLFFCFTSYLFGASLCKTVLLVH